MGVPSVYKINKNVLVDLFAHHIAHIYVVNHSVCT